MKSIIWNGKLYLSIVHAAIENGFTPEQLRSYINTGYKSNSDISGLLKDENIQWNGKTYLSIEDLAKDTNTSQHVLYLWLQKGYTCDEDVPKPLANNSKCVEWNGNTYESIQAAARANNVSVSTMWYRLDKGYTCDSDVKPSSKLSYVGRGKTTIWNGITYPSRLAAAKALGIHVETLRYRLKQGWCCDEDISGFNKKVKKL